MNIIIPRQFETLFLYPLSTPLYINNLTSLHPLSTPLYTQYLHLSTPSIYPSLHPLSNPLYTDHLPLSTSTIYPSLHPLSTPLYTQYLHLSTPYSHYLNYFIFSLSTLPSPSADPTERTIPIDRPPRRGQHAAQHIAHVQPPPDRL